MCTRTAGNRASAQSIWKTFNKAKVDFLAFENAKEDEYVENIRTKNEMSDFSQEMDELDDESKKPNTTVEKPDTATEKINTTGVLNLK